MAWHLQTLRGRGRGQVRVLPPGPMTLGRGSDCDLVLASDLVSRTHAELVVAEDVRVSDVGSSNGTYLNGARVLGSAVVGPGDVLLVGDMAFRLHASVPPMLQGTGWVDAVRNEDGTTPVRLSGSLAEATAPVILRYLAVAKRSGTLNLTSPPLPGQIVFVRGHVREVSVNGRPTRDPVQALTAILRWRGLFELDPAFDETVNAPLLGLDAVMPPMGSGARPSMYPRA